MTLWFCFLLTSEIQSLSDGNDKGTTVLGWENYKYCLKMDTSLAPLKKQLFTKLAYDLFHEFVKPATCSTGVIPTLIDTNLIVHTTDQWHNLSGWHVSNPNNGWMSLATDHEANSTVTLWWCLLFSFCRSMQALRDQWMLLWVWWRFFKAVAYNSNCHFLPCVD